MGISLIARIADGLSFPQLSPMMEARSEALYVAAGARTVLVASPAPMRAAPVVAEQRRLLFVLLGAAVSLLLTACANAASLELAGALARARTYAIQLAVGASRTELVRTGLLDGMFLVGLDIVGDKLMEINVFSPGGLGSAQKFTKINFNRYVLHALERKVNYMGFYGRNFDNAEMCTL